MYPQDTIRVVAASDTTRTIKVMGWVQRAVGRMRDLGLRQEDLKETLGVKTRGAVGHYFRERRQLSAQQAAALAARLGMSIDELFSDDPNVEASITPRSAEIISESNATRLDPEMIAESYAALSEIYLEERGVPFDLTQEPERFVLVYEARSRMTKNPSASDERRFGARVAEIVRLTGAELHGSRDGVPAEGDDKGPVARGVQRKKG